METVCHLQKALMETLLNEDIARVDSSVSMDRPAASIEVELRTPHGILPIVVERADDIHSCVRANLSLPANSSYEILCGGNVIPEGVPTRRHAAPDWLPLIGTTFEEFEIEDGGRVDVMVVSVRLLHGCILIERDARLQAVGTPVIFGDAHRNYGISAKAPSHP